MACCCSAACYVHVGCLWLSDLSSQRVACTWDVQQLNDCLQLYCKCNRRPAFRQPAQRVKQGCIHSTTWTDSLKGCALCWLDSVVPPVPQVSQHAAWPHRCMPSHDNWWADRVVVCPWIGLQGVMRSGPSLTALSNQIGSGMSSAGASPLARQGSNLKRAISMKRSEMRNATSGSNKHTLSLKVGQGLPVRRPPCTWGGQTALPAKHNLDCSTFQGIRCSPAALKCQAALRLPAAGKPEQYCAAAHLHNKPAGLQLEQGSNCLFGNMHRSHQWGQLDGSGKPDMLNLQVTVGCGEVCVFHAGGYNESSNQENSGVPRWEFFIGDRPHAPPVDKSGMRPPIEQVSCKGLKPSCSRVCSAC